MLLEIFPKTKLSEALLPRVVFALSADLFLVIVKTEPFGYRSDKICVQFK